MTKNQKDWVLNSTKEIVISKLGNSTIRMSEEGGENVAEFTEKIYNKLVELVEKEDTAN